MEQPKVSADWGAVGDEAADVALEAVQELARASVKFPPFNSAHEGFAVLKEEVDELWDEVKRRPVPERQERLRAEARQVAAMALRFMMDCTR